MLNGKWIALFFLHFPRSRAQSATTVLELHDLQDGGESIV